MTLSTLVRLTSSAKTAFEALEPRGFRSGFCSSQEDIKFAGPVKIDQVIKPTDVLTVDDDLRDGSRS